MKKFKAGDKVRVINNTSDPRHIFTIGKEYIVDYELDPVYRFRDGNGFV